MKPAASFAALALLLTATAQSLDWPQWRGPTRSDVSAETGLLKSWPPEGPRRLWVFENGGNAYSGPSIVAGKLFTMGTRDGQEILLCLDAAKGTELWNAPLGKILDNNWGGGPRSTPSVDGGFVYAMSGPGTLACMQVADGKVVWQRTMKELGGKTPGWGYTESVLVDGNQVVCTPGGDQGAIAALDKKTGATLWQTKDFADGAQYPSIVKATINGEPQYIQLTMQTLVGVSPKDGAVLWRTPFPGKTAVIPTAIVKGNEVFVTAGYGAGCQLVRIDPGNQVTVVYENKLMKNHHGGVILVGDHLYGHSDGVGWLCMDWKTGAEVWSEKNKLGKGAIGCADGMLYLVEESSGNVALIEASSKGWNEKGRFKLEPQTAIRSRQGGIWTHPVIANGRLYLRDQDLIHCYAVK
jgi:outer membrane protein assembly factor BamB